MGAGLNNANSIEIGSGRTGSNFAYIDLIGDTTYVDYGFRIIRYNSGANTGSSLTHRGTGAFSLITHEAAPIAFATSNTERMCITSAGDVGIGTSSPNAKLDVVGTITTTDMIVSAATPSTSPTTGASRVAGGQGVQGNQYIGGFSSLGGDANHPGIKIKVLTGTTAATQGGLAGYAHNIGSVKVVSVYVMVKSASDELIPSGHQQRPGCQFDFVENGMAGVYIYNHPTNSYNILSKPFTVTIIYTE
jgi:hypothetical protein